MTRELLTDEQTRPSAGTYSLGVFLVLVACFCVRAFSSSGLAKAVADTIMLIALCWWPLTWWDADGSRRVLKLLSFFVGLFYGVVGLMLLAFLIWPDLLRPDLTTLLFTRVGDDPIETLDKGILLMILAQCCLLALWWAPVKPPSPTTVFQQVGALLSRGWVAWTTIVVYGVSELARSAVGDSGLLQPVVVIGALSSAAIACRFARWLRGQGTLQAWLWLLAAKGVIGVMTGWRGRLLELGVLLLIAYVAERGRLPARFLLISGIAIALLLPVLIEYRTVLWSTESPSLSSRVTAIDAALQSTEDLTVTDRALESYRFLASRVGGQRIDELAGIAGQDVRLNGSSIWPFLSSPIPRFVWPEKPVLGAALNRVALALKKNSATSTTSVVWTQFTDMYLNFGVPGILVGTLLIGSYGRWLNRRLLHSARRSPETIGVFVVLFAPLWAESPMGYVFQAVVQTLMLLLVILLVLRVGLRARAIGLVQRVA